MPTDPRTVAEHQAIRLPGGIEPESAAQFELEQLAELGGNTQPASMAGYVF